MDIGTRNMINFMEIVCKYSYQSVCVCEVLFLGDQLQ